MNSYSAAGYFLVAIISTGILVALLVRFRNSTSDLELKITGLWRNENNTIRILIYSIESVLQAEVVWTRDIPTPILGEGVIRNLRLKYFSWGEGTYIDPLSKSQFRMKLKLKNPGQLSLTLWDGSNNVPAKVEEWMQVHQMNYAL
jgi:hypothetical protein